MILKLSRLTSMQSMTNNIRLAGMKKCGKKEAPLSKSVMHEESCLISWKLFHVFCII
jgi:hypothetical protein